MMSAVIRLDHLAVTVSDMDRSLRFYCDLLGLERSAEHELEGPTISRMAGKERVRLKVVRLTCPQTPEIQIDLQQYIEPRSRVADCQLGDIHNTHFCVEVDDLGQTYREWKAKGVEFVSEPVDFDLGPEEGKLSVVFFLDPDGNVLELVQYPKGAR